MTANSIDMKHIYEKGLEPVDFIKYTLPLDDNDCEELISLSIGAELLPLEATHICNVLADEQIEQICYNRGYDTQKPSVLCTVDMLCKQLQVSPEALPEGLVEAQMKMNEERSYGARSFKNFSRRLDRKIQRAAIKIEQPHRNKKKKFLQVDHKKEVLTWD